MRNTEFARTNFDGAIGVFRKIQSNDARDKEGTLALGLSALAMGLSSLASAIGDVYDKLQEVDRKLSSRRT